MSLNPQFGSIVPSQLQQTLANNYLTFDQGQNDFAQQYLPEIYESRSRALRKPYVIWILKNGWR